ncbi:MAG: ComEC/Rec2 family competence protein, partial [Lachnospirales bacterium]
SILSKNINTISPNVGDNYNFGDCSFTIISPYKYRDDLNNNSVGIKLVHGNDKIILMGDSEKVVENEVLKNGGDIKADLFKANHHGSNTSNTLKFLEAVSPKYVVISCGKDNEYGHPHKEAMESFKTVGSKIYRTDESGDIVFKSTGNGLECVKGAVSGTSLALGA